MGNAQKIARDQLKAVSTRTILALSLETISPPMYSFSKEDFKELFYIYIHIIFKRKIYIFITILATFQTHIAL